MMFNGNSAFFFWAFLCWLLLFVAKQGGDAVTFSHWHDAR
jgi:hypothetical protein